MTISVVQSGQAGAGGGSWAVTLGAGTTAGNTLFYVVTGYNTASVTPSSSSPLLGGSPVPGAVKLASTANTGVFRTLTDIWMLPNVPGGQTACAVTVTSSSSINNVGLAVYEVSGLGAAPAADQSSARNSASTPSTAISSGATGAITAAPEFVLGAACNDQSAAAGAAGFTNLETGTGNNSWSGYQIPVSAGGTYTWAQTAGVNANWSAVIVTVNAPVLAAPSNQLKSGRSMLKKWLKYADV